MKVKLWLGSDASLSSYIQNEYRGYGNAMIIFGSSIPLYTVCCKRFKACASSVLKHNSIRGILSLNKQK